MSGPVIPADWSDAVRAALARRTRGVTYSGDGTMRPMIPELMTWGPSEDPTTLPGFSAWVLSPDGVVDRVHGICMSHHEPATSYEVDEQQGAVRLSVHDAKTGTVLACVARMLLRPLEG